MKKFYGNTRGFKDCEGESLCNQIINRCGVNSTRDSVPMMVFINRLEQELGRIPTIDELKYKYNESGKKFQILKLRRKKEKKKIPKDEMRLYGRTRGCIKKKINAAHDEAKKYFRKIPSKNQLMEYNDYLLFNNSLKGYVDQKDAANAISNNLPRNLKLTDVSPNEDVKNKIDYKIVYVNGEILGGISLKPNSFVRNNNTFVMGISRANEIDRANLPYPTYLLTYDEAKDENKLREVLLYFGYGS